MAKVKGFAPELATEEIQREQQFAWLLLKPLNAAPSKKREGMIVFADGTNWNPGTGKGVYAYYSGAWNKL